MSCDCGEIHYSAVHRTNGPTFVYRLFDSADCLLYVGATSGLRVRLKAHAKDKPWWPEIARIEAMPFDLRCEAFQQETVEQVDRRPLHSHSARSWSRSARAAS